MAAFRFCRRVLLLCALVIGVAGSSLGDEKKPADLPLTKVVLFSSGVGYYEHRAEVEGNRQIELKFNIEDINDLLKSMVLQDFGGGKISAVNYGSKDPVAKALRSFAIDLTSDPTVGDLLRQIRGEKIQIDSPTPVIGTIFGVEKRPVPVGAERVVDQQFVNVLTTEGLRSIALDSVRQIKLLDPKLNAELEQALAILAGAHQTDKKPLKLNFVGQGKRAVRVGYIQESPIWKTSYRLVLEAKEKPFLQGWALVENPSEQDWEKVQLTLVSGRPISFIMDLYQPLYVQRPTVQPELFGSIVPPTYDQDLAAREEEFRRAGGRSRRNAIALGGAGGGMGGGFGGGGLGFGGDVPAPAAADPAEKKAEKLNLAQGVDAAAQAADVGELFQYSIAEPVTLSRQESAMLPILNASVDGTKVSIYNPAVHVKHPLNGLRLKNNTKLHLMQGPITVFDGGAYAGDARIEDLPPDSERLISYALDLETEVAHSERARPEQLVTVKISKGTLSATRKLLRERTYTVKDSGDHAKHVLIEHPLDATWRLVEPKEPAEKSRGLYRFDVMAEPGKTANLTVREEQLVDQQIAVGNVDDDSVRLYLGSKEVSDEVKLALKEIAKRKSSVQETVQAWAALEQQLNAIEQEQTRIRQNMAQLDRTGDLYTRYIKKFGEQEDQVESLRKQIKDLRDRESTVRKELDKYLAELDLS